MNARSESLTPPALERNGTAAPVSSRAPDHKTSAVTPPSAASAPAAETRPPRLGRLFLWALVIVIGALVFGFLPKLQKQKVIAAQTDDLSLATVLFTHPAASKAAPPLSLSGEMKPLAEASIYARANGYVRRWLVDLGAQVQAGQLLAELETPETDRQLAQARAELQQSEAARDLAGTTAQRWTQMAAAKTVSSQETDEKIADFVLKKAIVEAARANVQRLEELAGFAKITAPFAGTVTIRRVDVGQLVSAGAGLELFHIAQTEKLRVFVRVPQNYAKTVAVGQTGEIAHPENPQKIYPAKVVRTAGAIDPASRTLLTELEVENADGKLYAGSYAQVRLPEVKVSSALTVPANSLLFRAEGPLVGLVGADNKVTLRKVGLGRDFGASVEVLSGLTETDQVIINPSDSLNDGAEVRPKELTP